MKTTTTPPRFILLVLLSALSVLSFRPSTVCAQGTAFTYQGRLNIGGLPANGNYDFTFALFNNNTTNTGQLGATITDLDVGVTNGLFVVTNDFGANFPGASRWLAIGVRTNGGSSFTALSPLQELTPTPYAIYTPNAGSAAIAATATSATTASFASNVVSGIAITNALISGTFSGNGAGISNVALGSLNTADAISAGNLVFSSSPGVGSAPDWVTGADFNKDGKTDLAVANQQSGLSVLLNNGKGGFDRTDYNSFGDVYAVAAADVNGDGWPDLICAGYGNFNLTVLTNNGSGGFAVSTTLTLPNYPQTIVTADVNGDGKPDLITALYDGQVMVFINNGSGGFGSGVTYNVGANPYSIAATDVNGDGKVDLVCANTAGTTLAVLTNNGSGGFALSATLSLSGQPITVQAADVNGDGRPDIICTIIPDTCVVFTNNGIGGFVSNATYTVSSIPLTSFAVGDVNGDGKPDLLFTAAEPGNTDQGQPPWLINEVIVFTNNGSGGFVSNATYTVGNDPVFVATADVNGDGLLDVITANLADDTISVLLNSPTFNGNFSGNFSGTLVGNVAGAAALASNVVSGIAITNAAVTGTFSGNGIGVTNIPFGSLNVGGDFSWGSFVLASSPGVGVLPDSVCAADVNGDGHVDLISANFNDDTITVLLNNGGGIFSSNATYPVSSEPSCVISADVNGDGHPDLICANFGANTLTVLTNNGSGVFGFNATYAVGGEPNCVIAADVNGDGHVDLITANEYSQTLTILTNNGNGVFSLSATLSAGSGTAPASVCAADVNGDGHVDLICANFTGLGDNSLTVFTNNGSGGFSFSGKYLVGSNPNSVIAADVNGDGHPDLICANSGQGSGNTVTVLTNNGSGGFALSATLTVGSNPDSVCATDVNGDGHVDLVCANDYANTLTVYTNNGNGTFSLAATLNVGGFPRCVIAADVNGDGRMDLVTANANDSTLSILLNTPTFNGFVSSASLPTNVVTNTEAGVTLSGTFSGNGGGLTNLAAANLTGALPAISGANLTSLTASKLTGALPAISGSSLTSLPANAALLDGTQTFTGVNTFTNGMTVNTGAGTIQIDNDQGAVPGIVASGGLATGHARFRNALEVWPNAAQSTGGYLDVRSTNGNTITISLTGLTGAIVCSNVTASGMLLTSDRNAKENFTTLDAGEVLAKVAALPVMEWNYKSDSSARHIGPMAQDFHASFGLDGNDDKHISVVDEGGVALAAIKGLNQKLESAIKEKDAKINELETRLAKLEQLMNAGVADTK